MDLSSFYNQFRDETAENLRALSDGLLALEQIADPTHPDYREHVAAVFRAVHTIKGSARLLGFETVGKLAHTLEHILGSVREGRRVLDSALADELLRGGDAIGELVIAAVEGRPAAIDVERLATTLGRNMPTTPESQTTAENESTSSANQQTSRPVDRQEQRHPETAEGALPRSPAPPPSPAPTEGVPTRRTLGRQTVRVRVDRLDRLINLTGELALGTQVQAAHLQTLGELQTVLSQHERTLTDLAAELDRLRFSPTQRHSLDLRLESLSGTTNQLRHTLRSQVERVTVHHDQHALLVSDLEQEVMAARLLPIANVFANLPRAVRELSTALGKEISLTLEGETTEIDRKLLEALNDPLIHLVRNALDHGIEPPDERVAVGKSRVGHLTISATAVGNEVHVTINDDGRGMQPQHLRESAVRKGLVSAQAASLLSDQEALELIFLPGFSTAAIITDVSGRGVGMDVVRTNISELGGQVQVESHVGSDTTITLVLPLTLITSRVLLVGLAERTFGLPASGCRGIIWTRQSDVRSIEGHAVVRYEGRTVPLLRLADMLGVNANTSLDTARRLPTVLIGTTRRPIGLLVDRLHDEREAVVKPLGPFYERQRRYSGAIQLGDGQLVLLLNPVALAQEARGMALAVPQSRAVIRHTHRLLIADDSFTTRELIRSILQSAGYDVTAAVDGHDALDKLRAAAYDLVVSDVEMPRVNGFQLTARIRQELQLADLPVIIITSLASDDHKRQGLEAGAQAYIVKSQFNQDNLLETIKQLLGR